MSVAKYAGWTTFSMLAIAASGWATSKDGPWKAGVSETQLSLLLSSDLDVIEKAATHGLDERKYATRARAAAVMAAGAAQSAMLGKSDKSAQYAGVRDQALKVAAAVINGKPDDVMKFSAEMKPNDKMTGKTDVIDLSKHLDLDALMSQFKPEKNGGRGWEARLKTLLGKRSALNSDDVKESAQLGYQIAIIAQFSEAYVPATDAGKKKKSDWLKWSRDMGDQALALGKAADAAKPDDRTIKAALKKVEETCVKCHAVFRD
jgi:hypothetical protein